MKSSLKPITIQNCKAVRPLFQFFSYDMSEWNELKINKDGSFPNLQDLETYYTQENYLSYYIMIDKELAGIAVLRKETEEMYLRHFF